MAEENRALKNQVETLLANPPTQQTIQTQTTEEGFSKKDAEILKADIFKGIASEVKRFEAMIAAKSKGTI
jgi:hypothetical protein